MSLTWKLSEIRSLVRTLTGRPDTSQITNDDLDDKINDYYQNHFPMFVDVPELRGWFTQETSATDSGEYSLEATILNLIKPFTIDGAEINRFDDQSLFFKQYPRMDDGAAFVKTAPGLAIGTTKTKVANDAFKYEIDGYSYSKAAAETILSGDTIPQSKYGAFRLDIDSDGTISIVEASNNSTGYDTPALAIEGLEPESSTAACMGYVTVVNTSGTFVPGTTELDASGVTATYTDRKYGDRDEPTDALIYGGTLYIRPKADDIYLFEAPKIIKPDELDSDNAVPLDVRWGPAIAYGTALLIKAEYGEEIEQKKINIYEGYLLSINGKRLRQEAKFQRVRPVW